MGGCIYEDSAGICEKELGVHRNRCAPVGCVACRYMERICIVVLALAACTATGKDGESNGTIVMTYVKAPLNVPSIVEKEQDSFAAEYKKMGLGGSLGCYHHCINKAWGIL